MRNAILSILLFISIMCSLFFFNKSIINLCDTVSEKADEIGFSLMNDDLENSYFLSIELINTLQSNSALTSIYLNHSDFDDLINQGLKLSTYILNENRCDAMVALNLLQSNAEHIRSLQIPKLENIL